MPRPLLALLLSALALGPACETTPEPKPVAAPAAAGGYDARQLARAVRRIDSLRLQGRQDEIGAGCKGVQDATCTFLERYAQEDRNAAWKQFNADSKRDPGDALAQLGMEMIYVEWKIDDQAEQAYQAAIAADPTLAIAHARMGVAYARRGDDDKARAHFKKSLAVDPQDGDALLGMARLAAGAGDLGAAMEGFRKATAAWPEASAPAREAAELAEQQGDLAAAREFYRMAADRAPRSVTVRRVLAGLLVRDGKEDAARKVYEEAAAIEPRHFPTLLALAQLCEKADDEEAAFGYYRRAGEAKPDALEVQRALGRGYLKRGQTTGAETAFGQVLKLAPADAEAHLALARISAQAERYREAVGHYRAHLAAGADEAVDKERLELEQKLMIASKPAKGRSVDATFNAALKAILEAYKARLEARPKLAGQVTLKVAIAPEGQVTEIKVIEDSLKDAELLACIVWNIQDASFPTAEKVRHFTYPITFAR